MISLDFLSDQNKAIVVQKCIFFVRNSKYNKATDGEFLVICSYS